jgi:tetratricopeptide (TPR) repeat protein
MQKRTDAIAAVLSFLACAPPLLTGCSSFRGNIAFENAVEKQNAGDYSGAISDYNKAIKINPKDADAYYLRGTAKAMSREMKGACSDWEKKIANEY